MFIHSSCQPWESTQGRHCDTVPTLQMNIRGPERPKDLLEVTQQLHGGQRILYSLRQEIFIEHLLYAGDKIGPNPCSSECEKDTFLKSKCFK